MSLRSELIQVAAVAVATVEQIDQGKVPPAGAQTEAVFTDVMFERRFQDEKWGADRNHGMRTWLTILMEEVGEVANALLEDGEDSGA